VNLDTIKGLIERIKAAQNRRVAILTAAALAMLLTDVFFVLPSLIGSGFKLKSQVAAVKKVTAALNQQISCIDSIKERLARAEAEYEEYQRKLPQEEEIPAVMGDISTLAGKTDIEMIAVKPVKQETVASVSSEAAGMHEVLIEIFAKGGYHQIGQFINKLESFNKFTEIKDIEITADKATPRKHFFRLLVATYVLKE
jgi:Tfp pilus assembly protein PilO